MKEMAEKCRRIQDLLGSGVRYKRAEIIAPLVGFVCLRKKGFSINKEELVRISALTPRGFSYFMQSMAELMDPHGRGEADLRVKDFYKHSSFSGEGKKIKEF